MITLKTTGPEDTEALAAALATALEVPRVLALKGPLGSGKTTFARGFVRALVGGETVRVQSPTFALARAYPTTPLVNHLDLYRLEEESAVFELGLEEQMSQPDAFALVEWADLFPAIFDEATVWLTFPDNAEDERLIVVEGNLNNVAISALSRFDA